jgi:hypothetical protein
VGAAGGLETNLGQSVTFINPNQREGYMQRWNLNVQHEFPWRVVAEVGYTGNRGIGLPMPMDYDSVPANFLSHSATRDQATINLLTQAVANPFQGISAFAGSSFQNSATLPLSQLLLPYPEFSDVSTTVSNGFSWYHGFSAQAERRFANGFMVQGVYTWSKYMQAVETLNPEDTFPTHVISPNDRPQHFAIAGIYELPFGKGKAHLSSSKALDLLFGGWSLNVMYTGQSGPPITFGNIIFNGDFANMVLPVSKRTPQEWFNINAGFVTNPSQQLAWNYRTFPLRLTGLRADGINDWDVSVIKRIRLTPERMKFELRGEAKNLMNHAMFNPPVTDPTSSLFGQVTSTQGNTGQRVVWVSGHLTW